MNTRIATGEHPRQQPDNLRPRAILLCAAAVIVMVLLTALTAHLLTRSSSATTPIRASRYLTSDPADEIAKYQQQKRSQLEGRGATDDPQFVHIPIEQAMRELAARGSQ